MAEEPRTTGTLRLRSRAGIAAIAGAATVAVLGAAAIVFFIVGGDDDEGSTSLDFADPVELTAAARADYAAAAKALPKPQSGQSGTDYLHKLLGPPDAFEIGFFASEDPAKVVREETWYYYELDSAFLFLDGEFLYSVAIDDPASLTFITLRYDPLDFRETTTLDDVRKMLSNPAQLGQVVIPADYALDFTFWAGEHLVVAFDKGGALVSAESVPVAALE